MSEDLKLWRFHWDCRRMGSVDSIFAATGHAISGHNPFDYVEYEHAEEESK